MFDTRLIHQVLEWERRLEIENEKRKSHHPNMDTRYPTRPQACRKEHRSVFARIFDSPETVVR